jgi:hypothetical protein
MTLDKILVSPEFTACPKKHIPSSDPLQSWWHLAQRILPDSEPSQPFLDRSISSMLQSLCHVARSNVPFFVPQRHEGTLITCLAHVTLCKPTKRRHDNREKHKRSKKPFLAHYYVPARLASPVYLQEIGKSSRAPKNSEFKISPTQSPLASDAFYPSSPALGLLSSFVRFYVNPCNYQLLP